MERHPKLFNTWISVDDKNYYNYNFAYKNPDVIFKSLSGMVVNSLVLAAAAYNGQHGHFYRDQQLAHKLCLGSVLNYALNTMLNFTLKLKGDDSFKFDYNFYFTSSYDNIRLLFDYAAFKVGINTINETYEDNN